MTLPFNMPGQTRTTNIPNGSALSLVTWTQQEDSRWFGAKIPAPVKSVEFVFVSTAADGRPSYSYRKFEGTPLKNSSLRSTGFAERRRSFSRNEGRHAVSGIVLPA